MSFQVCSHQVAASAVMIVAAASAVMTILIHQVDLCRGACRGPARHGQSSRGCAACFPASSHPTTHHGRPHLALQDSHHGNRFSSGLVTEGHLISPLWWWRRGNALPWIGMRIRGLTGRVAVADRTPSSRSYRCPAGCPMRAVRAGADPSMGLGEVDGRHAVIAQRGPGPTTSSRPDGMRKVHSGAADGSW